MKGLIIKWKGDVCKAGISDNGVSLMINLTRYDGAFWSVGGLKMPEEIHVAWNGGMLEIGDEIEVEFAEFDEPTPHAEEESHKSILEKASLSVTDNEDIWNRKLTTYYRLKEILGY